MPSTQNKEGEYFDSVLADRELRDELEKIAMRAYGQDSVENTETVADIDSNEDKSTKDNIESEDTEVAATPADVKNEKFNEDDIPF